MQLVGTHIALQKPVHWVSARQVFTKIAKGLFLGLGKLKGQVCDSFLQPFV